ncbi:unannotated protein [freshwater metagenome]|uniref:Unannotated protein n=1 Tax=freshwater metagenome TaxID=449393 RepID=A0A6J7IVV7_9ZZZZ
MHEDLISIVDHGDEYRPMHEIRGAHLCTRDRCDHGSGVIDMIDDLRTFVGSWIHIDSALAQASSKDAHSSMRPRN